MRSTSTEYTGNGGFFFSGTDPDIWKDAKKAWQAVKKLDGERNGLVWLTPAPANNTWAVAVRGDLATKEKLVTLDDLGRYISHAARSRLRARRSFCRGRTLSPRFQKAYGFAMTKDQFVSVSGGNTSLTEKAASLGTDGVNAAMAYGTDGAIAALGLVVLTDTKGVQRGLSARPAGRRQSRPGGAQTRPVLIARLPVPRSGDASNAQRPDPGERGIGRRRRRRLFEEEGICEIG